MISPKKKIDLGHSVKKLKGKTKKDDDDSQIWEIIDDEL
jgi:hypothetical protein